MRRFSYCQMLQVRKMFSFRFEKKEKSNIKDDNIQFASSEVTYLHSKRCYSYVTNKRCDYNFIPNDKRVILSHNQLYRHTWTRWTVQVKWCKAALCAQTQSGGVTPRVCDAAWILQAARVKFLSRILLSIKINADS